MKLRFLGNEELTYPGYTDASTGQTLTCVPGEIYDILPVGGTSAEIPTDGRFSLIKTAQASTRAEKDGSAPAPPEIIPPDDRPGESSPASASR
jgi:hypothetical protein